MESYSIIVALNKPNRNQLLRGGGYWTNVLRSISDYPPIMRALYEKTGYRNQLRFVCGADHMRYTSVFTSLHNARSSMRNIKALRKQIRFAPHVKICKPKTSLEEYKRMLEEQKLANDQ